MIIFNTNIYSCTSIDSACLDPKYCGGYSPLAKSLLLITCKPLKLSNNLLMADLLEKEECAGVGERTGNFAPSCAITCNPLVQVLLRIPSSDPCIMKKLLPGALGRIRCKTTGGYLFFQNQTMFCARMEGPLAFTEINKKIKPNKLDMVLLGITGVGEVQCRLAGFHHFFTTQHRRK